MIQNMGWQMTEWQMKHNRVKFSLARTLMIDFLSMTDSSVASVLSKMILGTQILDHSFSESTF